MAEPILTQILRLTRADLPRLEAFLRQDALQAEPRDPAAGEAFVAGLRQSLARFDLFASSSHWLLAAQVDGQFVGYLSAARILKIDARGCVLFVDELMVLPAYRRAGVASALWREVEAISVEIGAWRIRLCVDADNAAARAFYQDMGLKEHALILCQKEPSA
jgi:ribosomal protein S18 acetylase RimI-like enzyme